MPQHPPLFALPHPTSFPCSILPLITKPQIHNITWTGIPATDLRRVSAFYSAVFDWTSTAFPEPGPNEEPEFMLFNHGTTHGGFTKVAPEDHITAAKHPDNAAKEDMSVTVTISVENIEKTVALIEENGGAVYQ